MATITTRSGKGSPLTNTELDANFTNLNDDKQEVLAEGSFADGDKTKLDGIESGATADQTAQEIATAIDADATAESTLKSALGLGTAAYTASTDYVAVTGDSMTGNLTFGDNDKAIFGAGSDLQIYHDGSNSYINENGVGNLIVEANNLQLKAASGEDYADFTANGAARLAYNNQFKLATTSTGIDVTGTVTADGLIVDTADGSLTVSSGFVLDFDRDGVNYLRASDAVGGIRLGSGGNYNRLDVASNGDISFYEDTGTTAKFFWDASAESLGIGTSSPASKLHIDYDGTAFRVSRGSAVGFIYNTGTTSSSDFRIQSNGGGVNLYGQSTVTASTAGSERMRIDSSGNVGIGTTSNTYRKLSIKSDGSKGGIELKNTNDDLVFQVTPENPTTSTDVGLYFQANGKFYTDGTERMRIDSSGNLLVGTTSTSSSVAGTVIYGGSYKGVITHTYAGRPLYINRLSTDGNIIELAKDGSTVGSISTRGANLSIGSGDVSLEFNSPNDAILPSNPTTNNTRDAAVDLGISSVRFKNLYLSGGVYLGGTGAANYLDDYETGTFTPTLEDPTTGNAVSTYYYRTGTYTKVGNVVHVSITISPANMGTLVNSTDQIRITGLPFVSYGDANNKGQYMSIKSFNSGTRDYTVCDLRYGETDLRIYNLNGGGWTTVKGNEIGGGQQQFVCGTYLTNS